MFDGILDEGLDDENKVSYSGKHHLGIILMFLGLFLLWRSYSAYSYLSEPNLLVLIPPTMHRAIFNFILGIAFLINGYLLFQKKR